MNLLFHLANTLLLFFVLQRMTKARWESAFVAALFALHPLHVESVAWVSERKDVLSTFFWILTMGAYCLYVERPRIQRYLLVVLFFVLGLMSKPMLVTLPFVLLLLDYWPLQRFRQIPSDQKIRTAVNGDTQKGKSKKKKKKHTAGEEAQAEGAAGPRHRWELIYSLFWEKMPLFALTVLSSIITYSVQQRGGTVESIASTSLGARLSNAFVSYATYIVKTIWPSDLAVLYPYPESLPTWQVLGAVLILIAVTITVIWKARRAPYLAIGWFWYAGTLVPVIGIVQVGLQARADRYTYVPLIGLFIMAAWGISELSKKWRYRKQILFASSMVALLCFCIVTWTQLRYWQSSITLFDRAVNVTNNNDTAYYNRGTVTAGLGNYRQAIGDFDKALAINPKYAEAYYNRGYSYAALGNFSQAIWDYDKALELNPNDGETYNNRGIAYLRLGNNMQAIEDLKTAARLGYQAAQNTLINKGIEW
jgi:hypothetical protein